MTFPAPSDLLHEEQEVSGARPHARDGVRDAALKEDRREPTDAETEYPMLHQRSNECASSNLQMLGVISGDRFNKS